MLFRFHATKSNCIALVQISSVALNEELFEALYEQYSNYKHQLQYKIIIDKENRLVWIIF